MLNKFSEAIRTNLTKNQRLKIVALVTIEVHSRDIIEHLAKSGCSDAASFEWLKELRFYWDRDIDDCIAKQTNTQFQYGYEYLGNSGRLVITPLTDRSGQHSLRPLAGTVISSSLPAAWVKASGIDLWRWCT